MPNPIPTASNPRVGSDWVLVPREPTEEMIFAASGIRPGDLGYPAKSHMLRFDYRAMIASAPTPPDRVGEEVGRDPDRLLKDALFACLRSGTGGREYGGVAAEGGKFAWVRFSVEDPPPEAGAGGDLDAEAKRIMDAAWPEYGGNNQSAEFWQAFDEAVGFTLKLTRSGKLVASTGSREETKGSGALGPLNWQLSEEAQAHIREIDLATVRPDDPRLSQTLIGPAGPAAGMDGYGSQARPLTPQQSPSPTTETDPPMSVEANPPRWRDLKWCQANYPHLKWTISGEPSKPVWWDDEYGWTYPHNCLPPMASEQHKRGM